MIESKFTQRELAGLKKEAEDRKRKAMLLSRKYGIQVNLIDLNPHFTRGSHIPKWAIKSNGQKEWTVGMANTRSKSIDIDYRLLGNSSYLHKVILHEKEHILLPRESERKIKYSTRKKYGYGRLL